MTDTGPIELEVPRDRQARFDPQLIAKYQRRFPGFDDKIISMYARGMSTRETPRNSNRRAPTYGTVLGARESQKTDVMVNFPVPP